MKKFLQRYWLVIFLSFLAVVLLAFRANGDKQVPTLISITPRPGSNIKTGEKIRIVFDQPLAPIIDEIGLDTTPKVDFDKKVQGTSLLLSPQSSLKANRYFFALRFNGQQLYSWSYFFTSPVPTPSPRPTPTIKEATPSAHQELGDPETVRSIAETMSKNFPLIKYVPYENEEFALNYLAPLKLGVKIKIDDKEAVKEKVRVWIKDKGVDPASHEIVWQ